MDDLLQEIQDFRDNLRRRKIFGSQVVAVKTAHLCRKFIAFREWKNTQELITEVKNLGTRMQQSNPLELAVGNVVRRILAIIREEHASGLTGQTSIAHNVTGFQVDLSNLGSQPTEIDYSQFINFKHNLLISLDEMIKEFGMLQRNIADQAIEHIHSNEVVMTFGTSNTVNEFLKSAARKRKFEVIVVQSGAAQVGHRTAQSLSNSGIEVTLITDSAVFALMARVNKVIVGTHVVMANGGLLGHCGLHMLALAAKYHSVPFVVCAGQYKLCPLFPYNQDTYNVLGSPSPILNFDEVSSVVPVKVLNPEYDYVPPELVSLFISNFGGHNPNYIYRLLAEYYHPEDYDLSGASSR